MNYTADAGYCCGNRQGCLRGTRKEVLRGIEQWLTGQSGQHVFWLNGLAGTGKSTIAQISAETAFADGRLGTSFFCSRDFEGRSNLQAIFPTLAFQLAHREPLFRKHLLQVLKTRPDVGQESLCSQIEKLIVGPLKAANIPTLVIVDALDECKDEEPGSAILSILSRYVDQIPKVKFFITRRHEPRIRSGFCLKSLVQITEVFKLHEVKPEVVDKDIELFFCTQFASLAQNRSDCDLTEDWPSPSDIKILCKKAAGFFIYTSTVIKFVMLSRNCPPTQQLHRITSLPQSTFHEGRSGIDILYTQVLKQAVDDIDIDDEEPHSCFRTVVGAVLLLFNPLSVEVLSDLLGVVSVSTTLRPLHSLLHIPISKVTPIHIFHKSFPDFLMDPKRCTDQRFFIDPSIHHREILLLCLKLMKKRLKKNICNLDDYVLLGNVKGLPDHRLAYIGDALGYACCFWTNHLMSIPGSGPGVEEVWKAIDDFFTMDLLFWIEVLSLMESIDVCVYALNNIQQWYALVSCVQGTYYYTYSFLFRQGGSCEWVNGSQCLLLEYLDIIRNSPSQLYHSALPCSPSSSWFHKYYSAEFSQEVRVVRGLPVEWGECLCTVTLDVSPLAVVCWKDIIAVGCYNGAIAVLDRATGSQRAVLSGHTDSVRSVTFSLDGTLLVSGGGDMTVKLWDIQTGGVVKTFHGHTDSIISVSISANCTMIASASNDKTIHLWDILVGECHHVIEQQERVYHVSFSPVDPPTSHLCIWWESMAVGH